MTNFARRHVAATGVKAGQYVPCSAERQCRLPGAQHVSGLIFEATKQWLSRDGVHIANADVSPAEVNRFRRSDDFLEFMDRTEQQPANARLARQAEENKFFGVKGATPSRKEVAPAKRKVHTSPAPSGWYQASLLDPAVKELVLSRTFSEEPLDFKRIDELMNNGAQIPDDLGIGKPVGQPAPTQQQRTALTEAMEFGNTVYVGENNHISAGQIGSPVMPPSHRWVDEVQYVDLNESGSAPEPVAPQGWEYLTGFTNQQGYHGAIMHESEQLDGAFADHILASPGYYMTVMVEGIQDAADPDYADGDTVPVGWGVLRWVGDPLRVQK